MVILSSENVGIILGGAYLKLQQLFIVGSLPSMSDSHTYWFYIVTKKLNTFGAQRGICNPNIKKIHSDIQPFKTLYQ